MAQCHPGRRAARIRDPVPLEKDPASMLRILRDDNALQSLFATRYSPLAIRFTTLQQFLKEPFPWP
jgi:hypothetical protein